MLLALLLQAAAPPPRQASPTPPTGQPTATMVVEPVAMAIAGWDADADGRTTRDELQAGARRSFGAATTGYLGFADWAERWLGDRNALPSPFEVDADNDDRITPAEVDAALTRAFDRLDKDKDGVLARPELLTIRAQVDDRRDRRGRRPPR